MKILFAVMGAEKLIEWGYHDLIRETWAKDCSPYGDFRFFVGRGEVVLHPDTVRVDASDRKHDLIYKVVEMCQWALEHKYDMMLKTDIDTWVNVPLIMQEDLNYDYIGAPVGRVGEPYGDTGATGFIQGSAMWLSRRSMGIIVNTVVSTMEAMIPELMKSNGILAPYPHSEDLWIGQVLRHVRFSENQGYSKGPLTYHWGALEPEFRTPPDNVFDWMRALHKGKR